MFFIGFDIMSQLIRYKITVFLLIFSIVGVSAQTGSNRFFLTGTEIVVDNLPENDFFYSHVYDNNVTIYSLAEFFQVSKETLWGDSGIDPNKPINAGKIVKVRLDKNRIVDTRPKADKYFTLKYVVKPSETLYSLSRKFKTDVAKLKALNNKPSFDIQVGELLTVGYYVPTLKGVSSDAMQKVIADSDGESNTDTSEDSRVTKYYLSDVIGFYDKSAATSKNFYVLFNDARTGSTIDIYNPMLRRHIKAKVIGKIPANTYNSDVNIIISPSIARELGIFDTRFKVNIKYEK